MFYSHVQKHFHMENFMSFPSHFPSCQIGIKTRISWILKPTLQYWIPIPFINILYTVWLSRPLNTGLWIRYSENLYYNSMKNPENSNFLTCQPPVPFDRVGCFRPITESSHALWYDFIADWPITNLYGPKAHEIDYLIYISSKNYTHNCLNLENKRHNPLNGIFWVIWE